MKSVNFFNKLLKKRDFLKSIILSTEPWSAEQQRKVVGLFQRQSTWQTLQFLSWSPGSWIGRVKIQPFWLWRSSLWKQTSRNSLQTIWWFRLWRHWIKSINWYKCIAYWWFVRNVSSRNLVWIFQKARKRFSKFSVLNLWTIEYLNKPIKYGTFYKNKALKAKPNLLTYIHTVFPRIVF